MRFKLLRGYLLFAVLCISLMSEELWSKNALASNTGRIVFRSLRDGNPEIYVMDANGGNQENLTNHPAYDGLPDWSPDGKKIAFSVEGRVWHIVVMDADGNNHVRLEDQAADPSWSPDGGTIAFVSWRDGRAEIYVIGVDGRGRKRVTHDSALKGGPSFSPDGRRIAYVAAEHRGLGQIGPGQIYVVGARGGKPERLTHNVENNWGPAWSPDGQVIAYYVIVDEDFHATIHLMTADGKYLRQLSDGRNARDSGPDISPLGLAVSPTSKTTTTWGRLKKLAPKLR